MRTVKKTPWRFAMILTLTCAMTTPALQESSRPCGAKTQSAAGWTELMTGMQKMHAAMASVEPSGSADVDFAKLMLPHHQAAIDMAKAELLYGKDPQMRRLAQEIITDQQSEIELMQLWIKQHGVNAEKKVSAPGDCVSKEH
jgi:uncharacterized protein (DUF305 family)